MDSPKVRMTTIVEYLVCILGVYFNSSYALEWESCGLDNETIMDIVVVPQDNNIIYLGTSKGLFKSENGGVNWDTLIQDMTIFDVVMHPDSSNILYASIGGILKKSVDSGMTWFKADSGIVYSTVDFGTIVNAIAIHPDNPDTLYAGTSSDNCSLYMGCDGGLSWIDIANTDDIGLDIDRLHSGINHIVIYPESTNIIYLGTDWYGDVFKSTDFGLNWQVTGLEDQGSIWDIMIDPTNPETLYASSTNGFYKTIDGGGNWININEISGNHFNVLKIIADPVNPSEIYISSWKHDGTMGGIYKTSDCGATWQRVDTTFVDAKMSVMAFTSDGTTLFLGGRGLYKSILHSSVKSKNPDMSDSFQLAQNFPNPFNGTTHFKYSLQQPGEIQISIYNIKGCSVKCEKVFQNVGEHIYSWDASNNVSGIYIFRLQQQQTILTMKCVYIK